VERSWTAEGGLSQPLLSLHWPGTDELLNYVVWDRAGAGASYSAYLGLSVIGCGLAGAPLALRSSRELAARLWIIAAALTVVSLFLAGIYVRPGVFTLTFLCIAAAASMQLLQAAFSNFTRLPVLVFALFVIDAGPSAIQPFTRTDMTGIARAGEVLAQRAADQRVLQITPNSEVLVSVGPDSTPLHYARVQMLHGPHKPDATKSHNGLAAALGLVSDDLSAHDSLSPQSRLILGMLNVGWVVGVDGSHMGLPARFAGATPDPVLGPYWRLADPTPVLASGQLEQVDRPASFDGAPLWNGALSEPVGRAAKADMSALVAHMNVDLVHRQAARLLVPVLPRGTVWPAVGPVPAITLESYRVEPGRVHLTVISDRAGFLRLSHPIYPTERITRNGQPAPAIGDVFSFVVVPIEAGRNEIEVSAHPSLLRQLCLGITVATVLALGGLLLFGHRPPADMTFGQQQ